MALSTATNNKQCRLTKQPSYCVSLIYLFGIFCTALVPTSLFAAITQPAQATVGQHSHTDQQTDVNDIQVQSGLPTDSRVPGGLAVLPLPQKTKTAWHFQGKKVLTLNQQQQPWAIVALPLSIKPGLHQLCSQSQKPQSQKPQSQKPQSQKPQSQGPQEKHDQQRCVSFKVFPKKFQEQHIRLQSNRRVNLSPQDLKRHQGEKKLSRQAFNHHSKQPPLVGFLWPVQGPISSDFGLKRFYNGKARSPHTGLDIAAPKGTEVQAPAAGTVLLTGDFFFNGKVIYLNHGDALVSMFCHLDSINVKQGDLVNTGDLLGKVGATGRATGPHLHWSLSLRNVRIDPRLWLKDTRAPVTKAVTP